MARRWDGTRVLAIIDDEIVLQNRHGLIYTLRLPDVVRALGQIKTGARARHCTLDGEIVFVNPTTGREEFTPGQRRCATQVPSDYFVKQNPVKYEAFDIIEESGESLEHMRYYQRKDILYKVIECNVDDHSTVECVPYERDLEKAWTEVIEQDREGLILKQDMSAYEHDRSYKWLKAKNWRFEVCNVAGFTPGTRARSFFFGSLVLEKDGKYLGCAGSGFNDWELRKFKDLFTDAPRVTKPFSFDQVGGPYTAIKVNVQVLVKYYQITDSKVMRFPIFILGS